MSRNARSNENGRFDEIFLERVNVVITNFRHFRYSMHFWTYLTSSLLKNVFFFRQKEPTEDENEGDKRQSSD